MRDLAANKRTVACSSSRQDRSPRRRPYDGVPRRAAEVAAALEGLDLEPSRRRGQSFLTDPFIADAEAALVGTGPGEPIVEVGGGLGMLTDALLRRGLGPLTVVEREPRLAAFLRFHFGDRVTILEADALEAELPAARAVVGNLPFSVATALFLRWFRAGVPRIVALVQKEVGDRLAAGPGSRDYGRLSILAALYGTVERHRTVPAASFYPVPQVDGRLVTFDRRPGPLPVPDVERLETLVQRLFSRRRKQLGNLLPGTLAGLRGGGNAEEAAAAAGWPSDWARRRPEELAPEQYFRLATVTDPGTRGPLRVRRQV